MGDKDKMFQGGQEIISSRNAEVKRGAKTLCVFAYFPTLRERIILNFHKRRGKILLKLRVAVKSFLSCLRFPPDRILNPWVGKFCKFTDDGRLFQLWLGIVSCRGPPQFSIQRRASFFLRAFERSRHFVHFFRIV